TALFLACWEVPSGGRARSSANAAPMAASATNSSSDVFPMILLGTGRAAPSVVVRRAGGAGGDHSGSSACAVPIGFAQGRLYGTCLTFTCLPRTYVRGYSMPPLRDWSLMVHVPVFLSKSL